jgi:Zn-dependent peptidase ImmA (M78 family)
MAGTSDARGYRQWEVVGRSVKKGAKSIAIFAPLSKIVENTGDGKNKTIIFGFRPIPVFRIEDTEGEPLPDEIASVPAIYPPFYEVAERLGIEVRWSPIDENAYGYFSVLNNSITLHSEDAFIYFHELAHAVHNTFVNLRTIDINRAEIVADVAAAVLCQLQGISGYQVQTYEYVRRYCRDKAPQAVLRAVMSALTDVEQVVNKIIDVAQQSQSGNY